MNEYLIYTSGGFCQDPSGNDIDNCQVLGRAEGEDGTEAIDNLLFKNPWIIDSGYQREDFMVVRVYKESSQCDFSIVFKHIGYQLLSMCETEEESLNKIKRYVTAFPKESDFNIVQYGNLLAYYGQIRDFYRGCGHPMDDQNDDYVWEIYKKHVGQVAIQLIKKK